MSFSVVLFRYPHSATLTLPNTIFTITSSSSSFRPRRTPPSSTNRIFPINQPKPLIKKLQIVETLAARDTPITFGKYKGKMLGTLPSSYLKWVSENLRAGDSVFWAKLADEVLEDDAYQDRIEWEFAERILHGTDRTMRASTYLKKNGEETDSVSMLLEISERFGWDFEDKIGWSKINFELLGTSKGGRIPRLTKKSEEEERREMVRREIKKKKEEEEDGIGRRRRQRRERMNQSLGKEEGKTVNRSDKKGILGKLEDIEKKLEPKIPSPFPGRESLLKKVMNKRKIQ